MRLLSIVTSRLRDKLRVRRRLNDTLQLWLHGLRNGRTRQIVSDVLRIRGLVRNQRNRRNVMRMMGLLVLKLGGEICCL